MLRIFFASEFFNGIGAIQTSDGSPVNFGFHPLSGARPRATKAPAETSP
jgi:hypothetical protein